jgi:hypothetical protein
MFGGEKRYIKLRDSLIQEVKIASPLRAKALNLSGAALFGGEAQPAEEVTTEKRLNVLCLMVDDLHEIKEYYRYSKITAWISFGLAIVTCILGLVLLAIFCFKSFDAGNTSVLELIAGGVSELFAGTALLVYNSTMKQLNYFYEKLQDNQMFLSSISLVDRLPEGKRPDALNKIIEQALACMTDTPEDEDTTSDADKSAEKPAETTVTTTTTTTTTNKKDTKPEAKPEAKPEKKPAGAENKTGTH